MQTDEDKIKFLISMGSDITGAAAGSGIGFLIGGPAGAALGGPLGILIRKALSDITNRVLSTREKIRVGATAQFAITKIKERLNSGDKLRDDGFLKDKERRRTDAEEIFEGVLLKAKNEHEEKKTKILGNIFANIAFLPGFSLGEANHLLQIAENLTYRQMCILSLIRRKDEFQGIKLMEKEYKEEIISYETVSLLQEANDIISLGLYDGKYKLEDGKYAIVGSWDSVVPNKLELTPIGKRYYQVMGIDDIAVEDIREVGRYLS